MQKQKGKIAVNWAGFIAVVLCIVVANAFLALNSIRSLTETQSSLDNTNSLNTASPIRSTPSKSMVSSLTEAEWLSASSST